MPESLWKTIVKFAGGTALLIAICLIGYALTV